MKTLNLDQIRKVIQAASREALLDCIESAFVALSDGSATVPPVGHLGFASPPGDMHIKYGYIQDDPYYVIKIASGFYENQEKGLSNSNGMMLVFDAETGVPECLLQDEGYLTDLRTALAGAVAARHLAPAKIEAIGIIGTGIQARMQLEMLSWITDCKEAYVYGRSAQKVNQYKVDMEQQGFHIHICPTAAQVAANTNLIVTTTASQVPLLSVEDIKPGTHITAMGADAPGKQELDTEILKKASIVACDSKPQCIHHGETHFGVKNKQIKEEAIHELGALISNPIARQEKDITIADLTGIATQDIKIASFVLSQ